MTSHATLTNVHVIAPSAFGGAESVVVGLSGAQRASGLNTHVIALNAGPHAATFVSSLVERGVPVHEVNTGHRNYRAETRQTAEILRTVGAQVVQTHVYRADFVGYYAARRAGVRTLSTLHGFVGGSLRNSLYEWAARRLMRSFDGVICVSQANRDRLERGGCPATKMHVVPNAFAPPFHLSRDEARRALNLDSDTITLGWVGRFGREKGADLLLAALRGLPTTGPLNVMFVGDGVMREDIQRSADSLHDNIHVLLPGSIPTIASHMTAFDALVISSRTEGLPMVMLEAMSARVPIIAFGVGGIPEVLDSRSAWLVPPEDIGGMRTALTAFLTSPDLGAARATAAEETLVTKFSTAEWVKRTTKVYEAVLRGSER